MPLGEIQRRAFFHGGPAHGESVLVPQGWRYQRWQDAFYQFAMPLGYFHNPRDGQVEIHEQWVPMKDLAIRESRDLDPRKGNVLIQEQAPPRPGHGDCWLLVIKDMEDRRKHGIEKYGKPVQAHNGRDPLIDAYQEMLDGLVYMRQHHEEMSELWQDLQSLYALLVDQPSREKDGNAAAVSLLKSILQRKSVVDAGCRLSQSPESK